MYSPCDRRADSPDGVCTIRELPKTIKLIYISLHRRTILVNSFPWATSDSVDRYADSVRCCMEHVGCKLTEKRFRTRQTRLVRMNYNSHACIVLTR